MIAYTHLAHQERYQIYVLKEADIQQSEIARLLGRSPSTIGRELRRNQGQRGYRPKQAQQMAQGRARTSRTRRCITERQWQGIATLIRQKWSPEHRNKTTCRVSLQRARGRNLDNSEFFDLFAGAETKVVVTEEEQ